MLIGEWLNLNETLTAQRESSQDSQWSNTEKDKKEKKEGERRKKEKKDKDKESTQSTQYAQCHIHSDGLVGPKLWDSIRLETGQDMTFSLYSTKKLFTLIHPSIHHFNHLVLEWCLHGLEHTKAGYSNTLTCV